MTYLQKTVKPSRSAPMRFKGKIIAETQWDTKHDTWMRFTIWETQGGAYIAVREGDVPGSPSKVDRHVDLIEPIVDEAGERDEQAMQIAVLDAYEWHDRAKALLRSELGWNPIVNVD